MIWYIIIGLVGSIIINYYILTHDLVRYLLILLLFLGVWAYVGYELVRFP